MPRGGYFEAATADSASAFVQIMGTTTVVAPVSRASLICAAQLNKAA
jgi:hypothetical protein